MKQQRNSAMRTISKHDVIYFSKRSQQIKKGNGQQKSNDDDLQKKNQILRLC